VTRNEKILARISRSMKILEVGPSYSPVLTRADGWNVFSLDHSTADELRRKYTGHANVDISRIQDVDFVWRDGPLETAIPDAQLGTFDACIGSHMIEHVPDLVAFFRSMERILSPTGVVSLVVPDKRFCFDFFQPLTMTGDVLAAHRERRTRHTRAAEFNAAAYMVRAGGEISWGQRPTGLLEFCDGDLKAAEQVLFRGDDDSYRDVHGWYFTISGFRLIMLELAWMGHLDFKEVDVSATQHCEFFITLGRGRPRFTDDQYRAARMDLLTNVLLDVREQTDFLLGGPNYVGPPAELRSDRVRAAYASMATP
jgi:SAM-dependent methyltransferase